MKLAISNIAWPAPDDARVADVLCEQGVTGVEIAPTMVWPEPLATTSARIREYRAFWEARGIAIPLAAAVRERGDNLHVRSDGHFNNTGHRRAGEAIAAFLSRHIQH